MGKIICKDINENEWEIEESKLQETVRVYGILFKGDSILLVKHPEGKFWELPGGGVDDGETEEEALIRELKEETGLDVYPQFKFFSSDTSYYYIPRIDVAWKAYRKFYLINNYQGDLINGNGEDTEKVQLWPKSNLDKILIKDRLREIIGEVLAGNRVAGRRMG